MTKDYSENTVTKAGSFIIIAENDVATAIRISDIHAVSAAEEGTTAINLGRVRIYLRSGDNELKISLKSYEMAKQCLMDILMIIGES